MSDIDYINDAFGPAAAEPEKASVKEAPKFEVLPEGNYIASTINSEFFLDRADKDDNVYDAFSAKLRIEAGGDAPLDAIGKTVVAYLIYNYPKYPDLGVANTQKIKRLIYAANITVPVTPHNANEVFNFVKVGITLKHTNRKVKGSKPVVWEKQHEIVDFYRLEGEQASPAAVPQEPNTTNGTPAEGDDAPW